LWALLAACGTGDDSRAEPFSLGDDDGAASSTGDADTPSVTSGPAPTGASAPGDGDDTTAGADTGVGDPTGDSTGVANDCPRVQIEVGGGLTLNVRPDPSTTNEPIGSLVNGSIVDMLGEEIGENIDGVDVWYHIATDAVDGYVLSTFATCTFEEPPELDLNGWYLPLQCGASATVSQGNFGGTSHQGTSAYAFDFALGLGTPLVAIAGGVVTHTYDQTGPGDPCYNGGDQSCSGYANYVTLLHGDGTKSIYMHLQQVNVAVGDAVPVGATVGLSGSTGWSTGRHAHVMRMEDCGGSYCQSVPLAFDDVGGDGVPVSGDNVVSGNCP
jgi:hypothetical protein